MGAIANAKGALQHTTCPKYRVLRVWVGLYVHIFVCFLMRHFIWMYRQRAASKLQNDRVKKTRARNRAGRAIPIQGANAELQANIDVRIFISILFYIYDVCLTFLKVMGDRGWDSNVKLLTKRIEISRNLIVY